MTPKLEARIRARLARPRPRWMPWLWVITGWDDQDARDLLDELDRQRANDHTELYGDCIMAMRFHLESVGITHTFADDAAYMAACEIVRLRERVAALTAQLAEQGSP